MAFPGRCDATDLAKRVTLTAGVDTTLAIDMANDIVTEVCVPVLRPDGVTPWHTDHRLFLIEVELATHIYCVNESKGRRERVGPLTTDAQSKVDLGFNVTHYGQNAMRLDTSGALAQLDKAVKDGKTPGKFVCTLKHLGKLYSEWDTWPATVGSN